MIQLDFGNHVGKDSGAITCFLFHIVVSVSDGGFFPGRCWGVWGCRRLWRRRSRRRLLGHTGGMICAVHPGSLQLQVVKQGHPCLTPPQHCNHSSWKKKKHILISNECSFHKQKVIGKQKHIYTKKNKIVMEVIRRYTPYTFHFLKKFVYAPPPPQVKLETKFTI